MVGQKIGKYNANASVISFFLWLGYYRLFILNTKSATKSIVGNYCIDL
jgi:hypothetical protein